MQESQLFDLGDILSITTGWLVSPRLIEGVYDILNYMTDDNLFTHQLPRASRECKPYLLDQHPQLKDVDASVVTKDNWRVWLVEQKKLYGDQLPVQPIPKDDHDEIDPITEAIQMVGKDKIITINLEEDD